MDHEKLLIRWGTKGFSLNVRGKLKPVGFMFCYPLNCLFNQSIITGFSQIEKKVSHPEPIIRLFRDGIEKLDLFKQPFDSLLGELKWQIDSADDEKIDQLIELLKKVVDLIKDKFITA